MERNRLYRASCLCIPLASVQSFSSLYSYLSHVCIRPASYLYALARSLPSLFFANFNGWAPMFQHLERVGKMEMSGNFSHVCIRPACYLHALARSLQPLFWLISIDSHRRFSVWGDLGVALDLFSNFKWVGSSGYLSERLGYITTVSGPFLVSRTHCSWFFACVYSSRILPARSCTSSLI